LQHVTDTQTNRQKFYNKIALGVALICDKNWIIITGQLVSCVAQW